MTPSIRVLAAQLDPGPNDIPANLSSVVDLVERFPDVSLAIFPELFLHGYTLDALQPVDVAGSDSTVATLAAAARRHHTALIVGIAERTEQGIADAALCIDETGGIAGCYRKVHLFGDERRFFTAGDEYITVRMSGVTLAPIICYDLEFPEPARTVAAGGAQLLVTIAANMDPFAADHALFTRSRALENRIPHVYVNRVGSESGLVFCGGSSVADETGDVHESLPAYVADVRVLNVPIGAAPTPNYLADRRPDVGLRSQSQPAGPFSTGVTGLDGHDDGPDGRPGARAV